MGKVPHGYCQCGCGEKTRIAPQSSRRRGWMKGEPLAFINGHGRWAGRRRPAVEPNPSGLCMCGCGQRTTVVDGEPKRYMRGHRAPKQLAPPGHFARDPSGSCECGCGQKTRIAPRTDRGAGWIKGYPIRFIPGHQTRKGGRIRVSGYVYIRAPEHPNSNGSGYVAEHVLIASRALGKPLPPQAVVHHVDGVRDDNRPQNLVVCEDQAFHAFLHQRQRALEESGDPRMMLPFGHSKGR
jgi:hypothetical protein